MRRHPTSFSILLLASALAGCAANMGGSPPTAAQGPRIDALVESTVEVGAPLRIRGAGFPALEDGWVDVTFAGDFLPADGSPREPAEITVPLATDSATGDVIWERFGVHRVPFGSGHQLGRFEGFVYATARYYDGTELTQDPDTWTLVSLDISPSVVVRDFVAVGDTWIADCAEPTPNAIHLVPYGMRVEALGFTPVAAHFRITEGLLVDGAATNETTDVEASIEGNQAAIVARFAPVPENVDGYKVGIQVDLEDEAGATHRITYPFTVRRPIQVYFTRPMEVAEIYQPEPVSGCIPGGVASLDVSYSESHAETRTRSVAHTESTGWEQSYGTQHTETYGTADSTGGSETDTRTVTATDTRSEGGSTVVTDMFSRTNSRTRTNTIDFSQSASDSYGWSVNDEHFSEVNGEVGAEAGGTIFGVVNIGGSAKAGFVDGTRSSVGTNGSATRGSSLGRGASDSTTASETESQSRAEGRHWDHTQSYSEANSFSRTSTWNTTKTYSEAETRSESIAMSLGTSDTETLTVSTTDAESLQTSGTVFAGMFGMWYRQTTRLARQGSIVAYDLCGNGTEVGQVGLDDWTWAPNLALGTECPPPTNFPEAECRIEPCQGR